MAMNLSITGAGGFMGRNLRAALENQRPEDKLWLIDVDSEPDFMAQAAAEADIVFHLAGVNRPRDPADFMRGNGDFTADSSRAGA